MQQSWYLAIQNFTATHAITGTNMIAFIPIPPLVVRLRIRLCTQITQVNRFLLPGSHDGIIVMSLPEQNTRFLAQNENSSYNSVSVKLKQSHYL